MCSVYKILPAEKKQFVIDLTPYDSHWKMREDRRQAKLLKMKWLSDSSNIETVENGIQVKSSKLDSAVLKKTTVEENNNDFSMTPPDQNANHAEWIAWVKQPLLQIDSDPVPHPPPNPI